MTDLSAAVDAWRSEPFPSGARDDETSELQADVALIDHWVAESVLPFLSHGTYSPAVPDVVSEARQFQQRAGEIARRMTDPAEIAIANACATYLALAIQAYEAFLKSAPST
ncbi:MAG: hypothetical protein JWR52_1780 [Marmoricola sp.]|nr:hypothetical protein [Marmoricola sp.]